VTALTNKAAVNSVRNSGVGLLDRIDDPCAPPPSDAPVGELDGTNHFRARFDSRAPAPQVAWVTVGAGHRAQSSDGWWARRTGFRAAKISQHKHSDRARAATLHACEYGTISQYG